MYRGDSRDNYSKGVNSGNGESKSGESTLAVEKLIEKIVDKKISKHFESLERRLSNIESKLQQNDQSKALTVQNDSKIHNEIKGQMTIFRNELVQNTRNVVQDELKKKVLPTISKIATELAYIRQDEHDILTEYRMAAMDEMVNNEGSFRITDGSGPKSGTNFRKIRSHVSLGFAEDH